MAKGPVLFELDDTQPAPLVTEAPVPDVDRPPEGRAMQIAAQAVARRPSRLARWFWSLLAALLAAALSLAAWRAVERLIADVPFAGYAFAGLVAAFLLTCAAIAVREIAALSRLSRLDRLRRDAASARATGQLETARRVTDRVIGLYAGRPEARWGRERLGELRGDQVDAGALLDLVDHELLAPLDRAASAEVEAAARQVATVTALVPLALADVAAALTANLRMIRRIAEIYGGRSGLLGGWRLTRAVLAHLVATGAIAAGDDLLEPILGGSLLARLSRRFGEGLVNGALTARVGVAAMEVCRPVPFRTGQGPRSRDLVRRALAGLVPGRGASGD